MAVGREGILILYRTPKPCLEKRDLRTGAVLWSYGDRAQLKDATAQPLLVPLNRMALGVDGTVYLAEGASLAFTILDPVKGPKEPGQTFFTCHDAIPGRALLGRVGRGPMLSWAGRDVIFSVFTPSQVKSCGAPESTGLVLARFDLLNGALEWIPTSLAEGHRLVGLLDHEAVFLAPRRRPGLRADPLMAAGRNIGYPDDQILGSPTFRPSDHPDWWPRCDLNARPAP